MKNYQNGRTLQLNGYDRIWDCGNLKYVWNNSVHSIK